MTPDGTRRRLLLLSPARWLSLALLFLGCFLFIHFLMKMRLGKQFLASLAAFERNQSAEE